MGILFIVVKCIYKEKSGSEPDSKYNLSSISAVSAAESDHFVDTNSCLFNFRIAHFNFECLAVINILKGVIHIHQGSDFHIRTHDFFRQIIKFLIQTSGLKLFGNADFSTDYKFLIVRFFCKIQNTRC